MGDPELNAFRPSATHNALKTGAKWENFSAGSVSLAFLRQAPSCPHWQPPTPPTCGLRGIETCSDLRLTSINNKYNKYATSPTTSEGRPFGAALQGEASNRHERLGSKAPVVSVMEKAGAPVRWGLER